MSLSKQFVYVCHRVEMHEEGDFLGVFSSMRLAKKAAETTENAERAIPTPAEWTGDRKEAIWRINRFDSYEINKVRIDDV